MILLGYALTLGGVGALGIYSVILYRRTVRALNRLTPSSESGHETQT